MRGSNPNYAVVVPFVHALAALGLTDACISPGSRNTPLSLAFAAEEGIRDWSHIDERTGSFFALGIAKTTGRPVAVVTTSGTAAAELLPAAMEARQARVPLLLLTADRPPELREVGAPQTGDQVKLYGTTVKWSHDAATPEATGPMVRYMVNLAARAWATALDEPAGPVHLNLPFREPLVPEPPGPEEHDLPELPMPAIAHTERGRLVLDEASLAEAAGIVDGRRTLLLCGEVRDPHFAPAISSLGAAGRPIVADPLSGVRAGHHDLSNVLAYGDALARAGFLDEHPPEAVIRFGAPVTSKALNQWLADRPDIPQIVVDPSGWRDPSTSATLFLRGDPAVTAEGLAKALTSPPPSDWANRWLAADRAARQALEDAVVEAGFPSEPGTVLALADAIPDGALFWVASSMPIRDVDGFFPPVDRSIRFLANRGVNGIDGFVSSVLGSAAAGASPTYGLAGDLSVVHDLTALATAGRHQLPVTLVVIDNDGGGVFHFLPQARFREHFERHFGTPHGLQLEKAADLFGVEFLDVRSPEVLKAAVAEEPDEPRLIRVATDREENVSVHEQAWQAVEEALAQLLRGR